MESQDQLRRRGGDETTAVAAAETETKNAEDIKGKRDNKKRAIAKRGIRSLAIAVLTPAFMTLLTAYSFGSSYYDAKATPFWFPPVWALHVVCIGSSLLMGLAAWLVWAESGFHKKPEALYLYLAQFGLFLSWDPIVFRMSANRAGLAVWLGMCGAMFGCYKMFKQVHPVAGDLVKPCLAWSALVAAVNFKLASAALRSLLCL